MKKILCFILVAVLSLGLVTGCAGTNEGLENAKSYVYETYKDRAEITAGSFDRIAIAVIDGVTYNVNWSTDSDQITVKESSKANHQTIVIPEKASADIAYVLTATISDADGNSVTVSFNHKVPKYELTSYAEYAAAEDDTPVVVGGIVTGIFSASNGSSVNGMYVQDLSNEGGYYVYGMTEDPVTQGIAVGMTVEIQGAKATYSGLYEVVDAVVTITDSTIKTVTPVDYTEIFTNADALNAEALVGKQSMLVTIKGVQIGGQDSGNGYHYFSLGGLEAYIRLSSSNNCITKDEKTAFTAAHTDAFGYVADVTGIIQLYSGNFYLIPATVDAITNITLPERTDAEKVALEIGNIDVPTDVASDTVINLPVTGSTYESVTFSWASDKACAVVGEGGTLTVTVPEDDTTVTLTVTATCGEATETKTFSITLSKKPITNAAFNTIANALGTNNATTNGKYLIHGIITRVANDKYGNVYIVDAEGNEAYIYGLYDAEGNRYDAMTTKPAVGDYILVTGVGSYYNGPQMKDAIVLAHSTPTGAGDITGTVTDVEYLVTGEVTSIANEKYGNLYIKDAAGNEIYVYGLYNSLGTRYDSLDVKPAVGDTITVLSYASVYNDVKQLKNAVLVGCVKAPAEGDETPSNVLSYTFANYDAGTQYAENEAHTLDEKVSVTVNDGHFTSQLRLYDSESNDSTAVIACTNVINSIKLRAGNKAALKVYGSADGVTYTLIQDLTTATAYADFTVDIENSTYKYIKLDAVGAQVRVESFALTIAE